MWCCVRAVVVVLRCEGRWVVPFGACSLTCFVRFFSLDFRPTIRFLCSVFGHCCFAYFFLVVVFDRPLVGLLSFLVLFGLPVGWRRFYPGGFGGGF
jgi:hypothetical protein